MRKGNLTKTNILKTAYDLSGQVGFEALSIGKLAQHVGLSKSGLFGHFQSKEKLQAMVLAYSEQVFTDKVLAPALKKERGETRLRALVDNWVKWINHKDHCGCPLLTAAMEYDDRPGPIQDLVRDQYSRLIGFYKKAADICVDNGDFKEDLNTQDFAFNFYSLMMGYHLYKRLMKNPKAQEIFEASIDRLIIESRRN